jgi:D-arabinose 1-dehydrogenase-like Zn-dependent alcohol dehydrogenase
LDDKRLAALTRIAGPLAEKNGVEYKTYNPSRNKIAGAFDYIVLMAPSADLVAGSVDSTAEGGIINIFAGIDVAVTARVSLDKYIGKRLYFVGTSGSVLEDMKVVLGKVASGRLDTNVCVAAVCGLDGAVEAIRAVESRRIAGKIVVYPCCRGLGLVVLEEMGDKMPEVARCLNNGLWSRQAEQRLLEMYQ